MYLLVVCDLVLPDAVSSMHLFDWQMARTSQQWIFDPGNVTIARHVQNHRLAGITHDITRNCTQCKEWDAWYTEMVRAVAAEPVVILGTMVPAE